MKNRLYEIALLIIIAVSSLIFFRNLGQPNLTMWDEVVHADVIKHLAQNCCTPTLLTQNWGTDFHDWTNTTVWLHKPLLPFYISAVFYKIYPGTLAIRLPALIGFELLIILIYFIGRRYFHPIVGLSAAALMAFNIYSFQLVQGTQFSGLGDIGFAFFVLAGISLVLENFRNPRKLWFVFLGLGMGLSYFFKGGLTLIPFGILGLIVLWQQKFTFFFKNMALSGIIFLVPVAIVSLYFSHRFGAVYGFEQHMQIAHLWQNVEGWGRPWDYYLTIYWPNILGVWLLPPFFLTFFWSLFEFKQAPDFAKATSGKKDLFVFTGIILGFFIPLSFAISKVPNFIYATLPLAILLICGSVYRLWEIKKYKTIAIAGVSTCLMYILLRFDLWFAKEYLERIVRVPERLLIIEISAAALLISAIIVLVGQKLFKPLVIKIFLIIAVILAVWSNFHANLGSAAVTDPTFLAQQTIRQAATKLNNAAPVNSAIIINIPELYRSNLYFEFWSDLPAMEVDQGRTISYWLKIIPANRPVFTISETKITRIR